jgi:hypothetical protein
VLRIAACLALMMLCGAAVGQTPPKFETGQVWTLKNAPAGAQFFIVRVDANPPVIYGYAAGALTAGGRTSPFKSAYRPYTEDAVKRSVDKLERTGAPVPDDFPAPNARWKRRFPDPTNKTVGEIIAEFEGIIRNLSGESAAVP